MSFGAPDNSEAIAMQQQQIAMQQQQLQLQQQQQAKLDAQERDRQAALMARSRARASGGMRMLMSGASMDGPPLGSSSVSGAATPAGSTATLGKAGA